MATPTTTRLDIRQKVVKKLDSPRFPIVSDATATAGNATTIEDAGLAPGSQSEDFIGSWIWIADDTGAGPNVEEVARVTNVNFTATNSFLTVAPAFSAAVIAGQGYEIHRQFHPGHVNDKIDEILENLRRDVAVPIGSMSSNTGVNVDFWTASMATMTEDNSVAWYGDESLQVEASDPAGYIQSDTLSVREGETMMCHGWVLPDENGAAARLSLWDGTADVEIDFAYYRGGTTRVDFGGWRLLYFLATAPPACERVYMRFSPYLDAISDNTFINYAIVTRTDQRVFEIADDFEYAEDMESTVFFVRPALADETHADNVNAYTTSDERELKWGDIAIKIPGNVRNATLTIDRRNDIRYPLIVRGRVDYPKLVADASESNVPEDLIVDLVYIELMEELAQEDLEDDNIPGFEAKMGKAQAVRNKLDPLAREKSPARSKVHGTLNTPGRFRNSRGGNRRR